MFAHRRQSQIAGRGGARNYLDCGECLGTLSPAARRLWNCGHLPRVPGQRGGYPLPEHASRPEDDTCPGYLIALPEVREALTAHLWWEKGQLESFVRRRRRSPLLAVYIEVVAGAIAELDMALETERERERRR